MNFKDVIDEFKKQDFYNWQMIKNRDVDSIWLHNGNSNLRVNILRCDNDFDVRLFYFCNLGIFMGDQFKIRITDFSVNMSKLDVKKVDQIEEIHIKEYKNFLTEEQFFQESLISDFGSIQFEQLRDAVDLYNSLVQMTKEKYNVL